jgi:hypothetical protein
VKKHHLGPQNGSGSLGPEKTAKNSKFPSNYFEIVVIGGWPSRTSWIICNFGDTLCGRYGF